MTEIYNRILSQRNTFGHKRGPKETEVSCIILYLITAKQHSSTMNTQEQSFLTKEDTAQQREELYKLID